MNLDKSCRPIVQAIGEGSITIAQIASESKLEKSTVYRLLKTMPSKALFQPSGNNPQGLPTYSCSEEGLKILKGDAVNV